MESQDEKDVFEQAAKLIAKLAQCKKPPAIRIVVDQREHNSGLVALFKNLGLPFVSIEEMDVGDIAIFIGDKLWFVFERKRLDDFESSMTERSSEQKSRLLALAAAGCIPRLSIVYLVEDMARGRLRKSLSAVMMHLVNISAKHGMQVFRTNGLMGTVYTILCYCMSAVKNPVDLSERYEYERMLALENALVDEKVFESLKRKRDADKSDAGKSDASKSDADKSAAGKWKVGEPPDSLDERDLRMAFGKLTHTQYLRHVMAKKSNNYTVENVYMWQLETIHRVTPESAKAVAAAYPSMRKLIQAADKPGFDKQLANIMYTPSGSDKPRRLGPATAKNILKQLD